MGLSSIKVGSPVIGAGAVTSVQGTSTVISTVGQGLQTVDTIKGLVAVDSRVILFRANGAAMCNLVQYTSYMDENPDAVADLNARCRMGVSKGYYTGALSTAIVGGLNFNGQDFNWATLKAQK